MKTLGQRIKQLRKLQHLTGDELGEKLNVGRSAISLWETDARMPSAEMIKLIANVFNVSIDYLLTGEHPTTDDGYYYDPEVAELAEEIKNDPDLRLLLDAKRSLSKSEMESIINITKSLLQRERGDDYE